MPLFKLMREKRTAIVKRWQERIFKTYPKETAQFLGRQKDSIQNPVGVSIATYAEALFDELTGEQDADRCKKFLDEIIRIRAVQNFAPSMAVSFIFLLKNAVRDELGKAVHQSKLFKELLEFESVVDGLALMAFDIHMKRREMVYNLKATELRDRSKKFIERMNTHYKDAEWIIGEDSDELGHDNLNEDGSK